MMTALKKRVIATNTITTVVKTTVVALACCLFYRPAAGQALAGIQNSFDTYTKNSLQEKVFVHTDKSVYLPGEILWFKIYCVNAADNKPLTLSKIVYVDIIDNNQNAVIQTKISMKNGLGDGSVYIPVTVTNGNYKLRAYTNWMKNFSPDFYFSKKITFVNPLRSPDVVAKEGTPAYDVQFFPEGGNLVNGIASKVAFKVTAQNGKGVDVKGAILGQHNDTLVKFKSFKFGMGNFIFTPAANTTYKAVINIAGSKPIIRELPAANPQGYVMQLKDDGNTQLTVTVQGTAGKNGNIYLFAHTGRAIAHALAAVMNNGSASFVLDKKALGGGISHITVFDSDKRPVCERLYFTRPSPQLLISAGTDQQQYNIRQKVDVDITAKDAGGNNLNANLSMAVYKTDSLQEADQSNILNYLWLSADLKGNVESPEYYFNNTRPEAGEAADNLMLTQGWSRFDWDDVLRNKQPEFSFLPEYFGHIITGKIVNTITGMPANKILTYLAIPGKRVQMYTSLSDSLGNLRYNTKDFFGTNEIIAQTNQQVDSTYRIDILSPFSELYGKTAFTQFQYSSGMRAALEERSLGVQVLNIYSGFNIKRFYDEPIDSSAFYGKPYKTYKLDDFTRFTTMEEDLREYVAEDNIVKSKGRFRIKVISDQGFLAGDPLMLVDGVPIFNVDKIIAVDPLKVRKLEVIPSRYYYGNSESEGIFSFTTYKGDLGGIELDPLTIVMDYEGIQLHRIFYSPVYDTPEKEASRIPDGRNLLFWSPDVEARGKASVTFYTSDQKGKFVGAVQGITSNGQAGCQYFTFDVK